MIALTQPTSYSFFIFDASGIIHFLQPPTLTTITIIRTSYFSSSPPHSVTLFIILTTSSKSLVFRLLFHCVTQRLVNGMEANRGMDPQHVTEDRQQNYIF